VFKKELILAKKVQTAWGNEAHFFQNFVMISFYLDFYNFNLLSVRFIKC